MVKKITKSVPIKKDEKKSHAERPLMEHDRPWTPFEMMHKFEREMDDMWRNFDTRFGFEFPRRWHRMGGYHMPAIRQPLLDIVDTGKALEIRAEVPGISKENIDIKLTEDHLEISAKAQQDKEETGKNYYHRERSYQSFYRRVPLPTMVDQKRADAKLEDGILKIMVPKLIPKEEDKVHKVKIK